MAETDHEMSTATDRGQYQDTISIVSGTERRDVSEALDLLALADTPFINRIGWGAESGGLTIEWISENLGPGYVTAGSVMGSGATSLQISTTEGLTTAQAARQLQTGSLLYHYCSANGEHSLWLVVSNGADGELSIEVVSTTNTFSESTSTTAGNKIYILGGLMNEGSLPRAGNYRDRVISSNCFSILRQDVQITGSEKATDFYAIGREDTHQILMRMKEMQREREKMTLYGVTIPRSSTVAGILNGVVGHMIQASGSANVDDSTTVFTENAFNTVVSTIWESGGENLTFFGNLDITSKFTRWDKNRIRMQQSDRKGGGLIQYYLSESGIEVEIVPMRKVPINFAFVLDTSKIRLRAKKGRKGFMQKLGLNGDFEDWQIISECSMEMQGYNLSQHGMFIRLGA